LSFSSFGVFFWLMDLSSFLRQLWLSLLILFVYFDQVGCKRGGISMGRSRGASAARGRSGSSGGGIFGGSRTNTGGQGSSGGWNQGGKSNIGTSGGHGYSGNQQKGGYGSSGYQGGGYGRSSGPKYTKSGVGSFVRSNQFKSAIVGAAAGYLTYQAGKAIIRNVAGPMMWNNRPYYWGASHYRGGSGQSMCRMPMDQSDPTLGNIYLQDNTRPREIVWGCGYNEYCCGYECCRGNSAGGYGGYGGYGTGFGLGSLIVVILLICCSCYLVRKFCMANSNRYAQGRG